MSSNWNNRRPGWLLEAANRWSTGLNQHLRMGTFHMNNGFNLLEKKWKLGPHQAHPPLSHSWLHSLGTTQLTQVPSGPSSPACENQWVCTLGSGWLPPLWVGINAPDRTEESPGKQSEAGYWCRHVPTSPGIPGEGGAPHPPENPGARGIPVHLEDMTGWPLICQLRHFHQLRPEFSYSFYLKSAFTLPNTAPIA